MLNWGKEKSKWQLWNGMGGHFAPESAGQITLESVAKFTGLSISNGYMSDSVDESGIGYALSGGLYWTISQHFNLGLGVRYSKATIDFSGIDVEAGGTHSGLILGYHW